MPKLDPVLAALGRNVRRQRDAKTFTQEKLAERSGLDPTYISDIERELPRRMGTRLSEGAHFLVGLTHRRWYRRATLKNIIETANRDNIDGSGTMTPPTP